MGRSSSAGWDPFLGLCACIRGRSVVQKGDVPKGSPTAPLHQPRQTGGHSMNIYAVLGCLISNREGIKVLGSVTALHVNSGQDENITHWFAFISNTWLILFPSLSPVQCIYFADKYLCSMILIYIRGLNIVKLDIASMKQHKTKH